MTTSILHIGPDALPDGVDDDVGAALAAQDFAVDSCGDVYRGLARLMRSNVGALKAVIVCLDGLGAAEYEFFAIVARLHPGVPVYVYAGHRSAARIERAISLGAVAAVTNDVLSQLSDSPPVSMGVERDAASSVESPGGPEVRPEVARLDPPLAMGEAAPAAQDTVGPAETPRESKPAAQEIVDTAAIERESPEHTRWEETGPPSAPPVSPDEDMETEGAEDADIPVRVPWLRHHDRPTRRAPSARPDTPDEPCTPESTPQRSSPTEPLLTDEELQALMNDDIASITPNLRVSPSSDDHGGKGE